LALVRVRHMSDCPNSCQDGLIWVDANTAAPCRHCLGRRNRAEFPGDYSQAGPSTKARARARFIAQQRSRGRRSGIKRRQMAAGRPPRRRERTRPLALAHAYRTVHQLIADEFERLYREMCERDGLPFDRRGLTTAYEVYRWAFTRYRACGQDFEFKNEDVMDYLERRRRSRSYRTVIYARRRLEAMGVFNFEHVKRGTWQRDRGWRPGERADTIRATALHVRARANCNLPSGAGTSLLRRSVPRSSDPETNDRPPPNDPIPPPAATDDTPASAGDDRATEREELRRAIAFQEQKLDAGWPPERPRAELRRLRQLLRLSEGGPP